MVSPPKAGNRTVLLPALVLRVLKACKKADHPRWMFPSPSRRTLRWTQPPSGSGSRRCWSGRSTTGCTSTSPAHLRHHSSPEWRGRENSVLSMLGHFDAGFTLRTYTHATRQKQDEAAQTMGSFMEQVM